MLSAEWVPRVYVFAALAAYFLAFAVMPGLVVWPSALGAIYPARALFQIGMACAVLPHFTLQLLWYVRTQSRRLFATGLTLLALSVAQTYIARSDDARVHGLVSMVHDAAVAVWMLMLYWRTRGTAAARLRVRLFTAYAATQLLSLHILAKYLVSGSSRGNGFYMVLKALAFGLELAHDYTSTADFSSMYLTVNWTESFTA